MVLCAGCCTNDCSAAACCLLCVKSASDQGYTRQQRDEQAGGLTRHQLRRERSTSRRYEVPALLVVKGSPGRLGWWPRRDVIAVPTVLFFNLRCSLFSYCLVRHAHRRMVMVTQQPPPPPPSSRDRLYDYSAFRVYRARVPAVSRAVSRRTEHALTIAHHPAPAFAGHPGKTFSAGAVLDM